MSEEIETATEPGVTEMPTPTETPAEPTKAASTPDEAPVSEGDPTPAPEGALTFESLELPEGFDSENPLATEFLSVVNNMPKTPVEVANAMLNLQQRVAEQTATQWLETNREWQETLENDPIVGGDKLDPALGNISRLMDEYARTYSGSPTEATKIGDDLRNAFTITGAGNQPDIVKFLIWTTSQLSEGAPLSGAPASGEVSRAHKLFGT